MWAVPVVLGFHPNGEASLLACSLRDSRRGMRSASGSRRSCELSDAPGAQRSDADQRAAAYMKSMSARVRANPNHFKPAPEADPTERALQTHKQRRDAGQQIPYWAAAQLKADETRGQRVRRRHASRQRRGSCLRPAGRSRRGRARRATRAGPDSEGEPGPPGESAGRRVRIDRCTLTGGSSSPDGTRRQATVVVCVRGST
jgi:hypothetical protein